MLQLASTLDEQQLDTLISLLIEALKHTVSADTVSGNAPALVPAAGSTALQTIQEFERFVMSARLRLIAHPELVVQQALTLPDVSSPCRAAKRLQSQTYHWCRLVDKPQQHSPKMCTYATSDGRANVVRCLVLSADQSKIAVAAGSTVALCKVFDAVTGNVLNTHGGFGCSIKCLAFVPSSTGHVLAAALLCGRIVVWDTETNATLSSLDSNQGRDIQFIQFKPDSTQLVTATNGGHVAVWDCVDMLAAGVPAEPGEQQAPHHHALQRTTSEFLQKSLYQPTKKKLLSRTHSAGHEPTENPVHCKTQKYIVFDGPLVVRPTPEFDHAHQYSSTSMVHVGECVECTGKQGDFVQLQQVVGSSCTPNAGWLARVDEHTRKPMLLPYQPSSHLAVTTCNHLGLTLDEALCTCVFSNDSRYFVTAGDSAVGMMWDVARCRWQLLQCHTCAYHQQPSVGQLPHCCHQVQPLSTHHPP